MKAGHRQRGSAVLYTVLLMPVLLLCVTLAVQVSALQMQRQRLVSALDVAAVAAGGMAATTTSGIGIDPAQAAADLRRSLADNLQPLASDLAGTDPGAVAAGAEIVIITDPPQLDPFTGDLLQRPSLVARIEVPVRTGLLTMAGLPAVQTLTLTSTADLRIRGLGAAP